MAPAIPGILDPSWRWSPAERPARVVRLSLRTLEDQCSSSGVLDGVAHRLVDRDLLVAATAWAVAAQDLAELDRDRRVEAAQLVRPGREGLKGRRRLDHQEPGVHGRLVELGPVADADRADVRTGIEPVAPQDRRARVRAAADDV